MEIANACSSCGRFKQADEFHKNRSRKNGLSSECKACSRFGRSELGLREKLERKVRIAKFNNLTSRACERCGIEKPVQEFRTNSGKERDHRSICNPCMRARRRDSSRETKRNLRRDVSDGYVRGLLTRGVACASDIPLALIEIKRLEIQIKRLVKDLENEKC